MKGGGGPEDVTRAGDKRTNSILGGNVGRLSEEILAMSDDVTEFTWKLDLQ